jgi:hypothetical protein
VTVDEKGMIVFSNLLQSISLISLSFVFSISYTGILGKEDCQSNEDALKGRVLGRGNWQMELLKQPDFVNCCMNHTCSLRHATMVYYDNINVVHATC